MGKSAKKKVSPQHSSVQEADKRFVAPATAMLPGAETSNDRICWRFCHVDSDGPWGFGELTMGEIISKLADLESMTINELFSRGEEPGKHYDVPALPTKRSRDRLEDLKLGDMTKISRLRLGGTIRLYGFLIDHCFHILWWDPKHEIWPSKKKHT